MKAKCVSDLLWILAHFGSHISDSPYLLEHIVEEHFEVGFIRGALGVSPSLLFDDLLSNFFCNYVICETISEKKQLILLG